MRLRFAALFTSFCAVLLILVSCGQVPQVKEQEETKDPVSFNLVTANTTASAGNFVEIPVKLNVPVGQSVYGMDVTFTYDSSILEPVSAAANKQLVHLAASDGQGYLAILNADANQSIDVIVTAKVLSETASTINFTADLITDDGTKLEEARSGVTAKGAEGTTDDRLGAQSVSTSLTARSSYTPGQGGKASIAEAKTLDVQFTQLKQDPILAQAFSSSNEISAQSVVSFPEAKKEWLESELGDLNQNAVVNLGDSVHLLQGILGQKQLSDYERFTGDLVDDQKLDEVDVAALVVKVGLLKVQKLIKTPSMSLHSSPLFSISNYGKTNEVRELALSSQDTGLLLIGNNGNSTLKVTVSGAPAWLSVTQLTPTKKYTTVGYELKLLSNAPAANSQGSEAELTFSETSIRPYQVKKVKIKIFAALTATFTTTPIAGQAPLKVDADASNANALATDTYAWEFGDSSATATNPNTATGITASHTYAQAGTYTIKLTVQRGSKTATTEKVVYVLPTQTELPTSWQRIDLSSPSSILPPSSSSFDPTTNAFTLSAYADANQTVNHFVYQSLAGDGSIVAKVQLADSSSSTAKAGLMLRQSNEVPSPFVFAYLQNGKPMVEYRDDATNQVVTVEGGVLSAATEARFLKIERKEGSVYVYESGDLLNFRQIAVISLLFTSPVQVGLVSDVSNGLAQVQFDSVLVQAQRTEELNAAFTASVTSGQAPLTVTFDASASTGKGELTFDWYVPTKNKADGKTVTYVFDEPGDYGVSLWLKDETGTKIAYQVIQVTGNAPKKVIQASFSINTNEIEGAETIVGIRSAPIAITDTITVRNPETGWATDVVLMDKEKNILAKDWIIPGVKNTLEFNAYNTVLGEALSSPVLVDWPQKYKIELYGRFAQHPMFRQIVDELKADKGWRLDGEEERVQKIAEIVRDVARAYAIEKGWVDPDDETIIIPTPDESSLPVPDNTRRSATSSSTSATPSNLDSSAELLFGPQQFSAQQAANTSSRGHNEGRFLGTNDKTDFIFFDVDQSNALNISAKNFLAFRAFVYPKGQGPGSITGLGNGLTLPANDFVDSPSFLLNIFPNFLDPTRTLKLELDRNKSSYDSCGVYDVLISATALGDNPLTSPIITNTVDLIQGLLSAAYPSYKKVPSGSLLYEQMAQAVFTKFNNAQDLLTFKGNVDTWNNDKNPVPLLEQSINYFGEKLIQQIFSDNFEGFDPNDASKVVTEVNRYKKIAEVTALAVRFVTLVKAIDNETNGNFGLARFSTGSPILEVVPNFTQPLEKLWLGENNGEKVEASFAVSNIGCRPLAYKAGGINTGPGNYSSNISLMFPKNGITNPSQTNTFYELKDGQSTQIDFFVECDARLKGEAFITAFADDPEHLDFMNPNTLTVLDVSNNTVPINCRAPKIENDAVSPATVTAIYDDKNEPVEATLTFENNLSPDIDWELNVKNVSSNASWLEIKTFPSVLQPGEQATIDASYKCPSKGDFNGTVTVETDDPEKPTRELFVELTCVSPDILVQENPVTGPTTEVKEAFEGSFEIANAGDVKNGVAAELFLKSVTVENAELDLSIVSYVPDVVQPNVLGAPAAKASYKGTCPDSAGTYKGTFRIESNDPDQPNLSVPFQIECEEGEVTVTIGLDGETYTATKTITCDDVILQPASIQGSAFATDPNNVVSSISLSGAFEAEVAGISVSQRKEFSKGTYTYTATATTKDGKTYSKSATFTVVEEESGPPDCTIPPPLCPSCNSTGPDTTKPIYMTVYKPKVQPKPTSYAGGWGCFGNNCRWGGGGGGGWGGWGWGLSGISLGTRPVGKTFGDPHISTADGVAYSTMKLGEFVYARSSLPDGVEIQARQTRLPNFADWASFNTAIAVKVGGHIFEVRVPASRKLGDDLILLIDGEISELPEGEYTIGDAFIKIGDGNELKLYYEEPNMPAGANYAPVTEIYVGAMTENSLVRTDPTSDVLSLEANISTPPIGRYKGLFGTIDGNPENEPMMPNGSYPQDWDGFIESWRVTDRTTSLFTYAPGEGPETYNLVQSAQMPTLDQLLGTGGGRDFFAEAKALLENQCDANTSAIDPTFLRFTAIELAAGRPADNMIDSGICLDEHVDGAGEPEVNLSGFEFSGRLSLSGHPEVDLTGAKVTIYSPTLGQAVCETNTFAEGRYSCGSSFFTPNSPDIQLTYRITGRGAPIEITTSAPTPQGGQWGKYERNFEVTLERVLHVKGQVTLANGSPVSNAQVRVSGPAYLLTHADDTGYYDVYLPLPDGVTMGVLTIDATKEDHSGYGKSEENLLLDTTGIIELERNIILEPDKKPDPKTEEDVRATTLVFIGRLLNAKNPTIGVGSATMMVSAPGFIEDATCQTMTNGEYNGYFNCYAKLLKREAFTATITATNMGSPVSKSVAIAVADLPSAGTTNGTEIGTLTAQPQAIRLTGIVSAPGELEIDANIKLKAMAGTRILNESDTTTSRTGNYEMLLAIPNDAPNEFTLTYDVTLDTPIGAITTSRTVTVTKPSSILSDFTQDIEFQTRKLVFTGKVINELVNGAAVPNTAVRLTRTDTNEVICQVTTDGKGFYKCNYETIDTRKFNVVITVSGIGSVTKQTEVDPSNASLDGVYPVVTNLPISPATVKISGTVLDNIGTGIEGAVVRASLAGELKTNRAGGYTFTLSLPNNATSGSVKLDVEYDSPFGKVMATKTLTYTVSIGSVQDLLGDFTLDVSAGAPYDLVSLEGRLINETVPFAVASQGIELLIEIVGATTTTFCTSVSGEQGLFSCGMLDKDTPKGIAVPRKGTLTLRYTAMLNGKALVEPVTETYTVTPSATIVNRLRPEVRIRPAMLEISGRVLDLANQPVSQGDVVTELPVTRRTKTDSQGDYEMYVPLPLAETSGTLRFSVSLAGVTKAFESAYTVAAGSLVKLPLGTNQLDFNLFGRGFIAEGSVLPANAADLRLQNTTISISSPTEGLLCESEVNASTGTYRCETFTTNVKGFDVVYTVQGPWGTRTYTGQVPSGLFGIKIQLTRNLDVPVTVLAYTGQIADDLGAPQANISVVLKGSILGTYKTNATGGYTIKEILPDGTDTVTIELLVNGNDAELSKTETVVVPLTAQAITQHQQTIVITKRRVTLNGQLSNSFAPTMKLANSSLTLSLAGVDICQTTTNSSGSYNCPAFVLERSGAVELAYTASGAWGSETGTVTIAATDIPAAGSSGSVTINLALKPTTLLMKGTVTDELGQPLTDARVVVTGAASATLRTNAQGVYEGYVAINAAQADVTLTAQFGSTGLSTAQTLAIALTTNALTTQTQDFVYNKRILQIGGTVKNVYTNQLLANAPITVRQGTNTFCTTTTNSSGTFTCPDVVVDGTNPVDLAYFVTGVWGTSEQTTTIASADLPAVGQRKSYTLSLTTNPTTLKVSGLVTDKDGVAVANTTVNISGGATKQLTTDASGKYETFLTFTEALANLTLTVQATDGTNTARSTKVVTLEAGKLVTLEQTFKLENREPGQARWSVGEAVLAQAIGLDGTIYSGHSNKVVASNPDGTQRWSFTTTQVGSILVNDSVIYVGASRKLYALNADGTQKWVKDTTSTVSALALASDGTLYAGSSSTAYAFAADGTQRWTATISGSVSVMAVASDATLYIGTSAGLTALNPNGTQKWFVTQYGYGVTALAFGSNNEVYAAFNYYLLALDAGGSAQWNRYYFNRVYSLANTTDKLIVGAGNEVSALTFSGNSVWTLSTNGIVRSLILGNDGQIYAARNTVVSAITSVGSEVWGFTSGGTITALSLGNDGTLYAGSNKLYAINVTATALADSVWPKTFRDNQNGSGFAFDNVARRYVTFTGKVSNKFQPTTLFANHDVAVQDNAGTVLCRARTDATNAYTCTAQITILDSFPVSYGITGEKGMFSASSSVAAGEANSNIVATQDLDLPVTTLHVSGYVRKTNGDALAGASVTVYDGYSITPTITTDTNGFYQVYFTYNAGRDFTLFVDASDGANLVRKEQTLSAPTNTLTSVVQDFVVEDENLGTAKWSLATVSTVTASVKATDGTLYASSSNRVYAVNTDGTIRWQFQTYSDVYALTVAEDGTLYVGSYARVYALNQDGTKKWEKTVSSNVVALALAHDGTLYAANSRTLLALDNQGTQKWQFTSALSYSFSTLAVADDGTVYASSGSNVYAINPDGTQRWRTILDYWVYSFAIANSTLYVGTESTLTALTPQGSVLLTKYLGYYQYIYSLVIGQDGSIFTASEAGVRKYDASGNQLWSYTTSARKVLLGDDGLLYAAATDRILALTDEGVLDWSFLTSNYIATLAVGDATLYAGSNKLYAVRASATALAATAWPKEGRDDFNRGRTPYSDTPRRLVRLTGILTNPNEQSKPLSNYRVSVKQNSGDIFCVAYSDTTGRYTCAAPTQNLDAFALSFDVSGDKGSMAALANVSVAAGTSGVTLEQNLSLPVTTVRIYGIVTNGATPIANATVTLSGNISSTLTTKADGSYDAYFTFAPTWTTLSATLQISDGINTTRKQLSVTLTPGQLHNENHDFVLASTLPGTAQWAFNASNTITAQVMGTDGTLYIGRNGRIYAVNPNGTQKWLVTLSSSSYQVATLTLASDGYLYAGTRTRMLKLNPATGTTVWSFNLGTYTANSVAVTQTGQVYMGANELFALANNGGQQWMLDTDSDVRRVAVAGDGTIFATTYNTLYAVSSTGSLLWSKQFDGMYALALDDDTVYLGSYESNCNYYCNYSYTLNAFDLLGNLEWEQTFDNAVQTLALGANDTLYAAVNDTLYSLDKAGQTSWSYDVNEYIQEFVLAQDNVVYLSTYSNVFGIDLSGNRLWQFAAPSTRYLTLGNALLFVGGDKLYAVNSTSTGLLNSLWPSSQRNNQNDRVMPVSTVEKRTVRFEGKVIHPHRSGTLAGYQVDVKKGQQLLCRSTSDNNGGYGCNSRTSDLGTFDATLVVGSGSSSSQTIVPVTAGTANSTTTLTQDLSPVLTTLHLVGTVTNASDEVLPNTEVTLSGGLGGEEYWYATTDVNGSYEFYIDRLSAEGTFAGYLRSSDGSTSVGRAITVNLTPNQLTEQREDIAVKPTILRLSGIVTDGNGAPRSNATVSAWQGGYASIYQTVTGSDGSYAIDLTFSDSASITLYLTAADGTISIERTTTVNVVAGSVTTHVENFELNSNPVGAVKWTYPSYASNLVYNGDTLYTAGETVSSLNPETGTENWALDTTFGAHDLTVATDGTLYFASRDSESAPYTLKAATADGTLTWTSDLTVNTFGLGSDEVLYVASTDGLHVLDATGSAKWHYTTSEEAWFVVLTQDKIYLGTDTMVHALAMDGTALWSFTVPTYISALVPGADGKLYVGSTGSETGTHEGVLYALSNGSLVWQQTLAGTVNSVVTATDGTLYVPTYTQDASAHQLYALNPDGTQKWQLETTDYVYSTLVGSDGVLYAGAGNTLYALNPDGSTAWSLSEDWTNTLSMSATGTLFLGGSSSIYAINTTSQGLATSAWPKNYGDVRNTGQLQP